ncbi:MAG: hypothetical protein P8N63_16510 [Pseudomonadales bacterium]|nr:hypothetical protein [Pseudomonadales bacterium]
MEPAWFLVSLLPRITLKSLIKKRTGPGAMRQQRRGARQMLRRKTVIVD